MKRGRRVDPALLEVKAPRHEEREPVFLSAAEVEHLASWCARSTSPKSGLGLAPGAGEMKLVSPLRSAELR